MRRISKVLAVALVVLSAMAASHASLGSGDEHGDVLKTVATFQAKDPGLQRFFDNAAGYAVFPAVAEGAIGVGAAHGTGELMTGDKAIGKISLTQVTVGLQLGGQSFAQIIFFENERTLDGFKHGDFAFAAQASAVALASGASANAAYRNGVAVFTATKGGLMYQASVGGQKFSYKAY
jgi:lipid-binding SYLF domain-containing protein